MQHQSVNIGFAIWGVRNGFEIMLASNPAEAEFLKADVITDKMRQVCNVASHRFYSLHRNGRFAAATIYHTDAKDIFDRNAYIAITLYIPLTQIFKGNALATLNKLMDFYILKQGDSRVNMFTEQMILDQCSALSSEPFTGKHVQGGKLGYFNYETEDEIVDRFDQINIEGFKAVFFLPPGNANTVQQLTGYEQVTNFYSTSRISFENYDPEVYNVYYNSRAVSGPSGTLHIDGFPGEQVVIADKKTGRQKTLEITKQDQSHPVWTILPIRNSPEPEIIRSPKKPNSNVLMISVVLFSLVVIGSVLYIFRDDIIPKDPSGDLDNKTSDTVKTTDPSNTPTVESDQTKSTDKLIDTITFSVKEVSGLKQLGTEQRKSFKKIVGSNFKINDNGDLISIKIASNGNTVDSLRLIISNALKVAISESAVNQGGEGKKKTTTQKNENNSNNRGNGEKLSESSNN